VRPTVLVTGATGFIGRRLCARLGHDHQVLALVRSREGQSAHERARALDPSLVAIEGDLDTLDPADLARQVRSALDALGATRLHGVVSCAARIRMDHAGQTAERRRQVADRNHQTNVEGLRRLAEAFEILGPPPSVRIARPSIVAGVGSKDAYMAFLAYLNGRAAGVRLATFARLAMQPLPRHVCVPLPGNPQALLDIVDCDDVVEALTNFLAHDLALQKGGPGVGAWLHVSTAYVHGRSTGLLKETGVPPSVQTINSYEASKGEGERLLAAWVEGRAPLAFNHLTNPSAPTVQQVVQLTLRASGWSEHNAQRLRFFPQGAPFQAAMADFRRQNRVTHRVARGLWDRVPMLVDYLDRPEGVRFCTDQTQAVLARQHQTYAPRAFDEAYVRELVAAFARSEPRWRPGLRFRRTSTTTGRR